MIKALHSENSNRSIKIDFYEHVGRRTTLSPQPLSWFPSIPEAATESSGVTVG